MRLRLCFSTVHSTQIRGFMSWLSRYVCAQGLQLLPGHMAAAWLPHGLGSLLRAALWLALAARQDGPSPQGVAAFPGKQLA